MKLLTEHQKDILPDIGEQEGEDLVAHVKLFAPWTNWTWWICEYDPETHACYGLVRGLDTEVGYFSLDGLAQISGPGGLRIERDLHFTATTVKALMGGD